MKKTIAALAIVLVLAGAHPAAAGIDPIDWINTVILQDINHVLSTMILWEHRLLDKANIDVYNRYRFFAFTEGVFNTIRSSTADVRAIRNEIAGIACGWQFSPRTNLLQSMYLQPLKLCRPSFHLIWGTHDVGPDRDLNELNDYVAVLTANQVSMQVDSQETTTRAFRDTFLRSAVQGFSPGEANRAEAVMLAMAGQAQLANNQLQAQKLLVSELERDLDRREERHAQSFSTFAVHALGTVAEPLPLEGGRQ